MPLRGPEFDSAHDNSHGQHLITSGPNQNVDHTVAFIAGRLGLPVPEDLITQPAPEDVSRIYREAVAEGWDFDGYSLEEILSLPPDQQTQALDSYRRTLGGVVLGEAPTALSDDIVIDGESYPRNYFG